MSALETHFIRERMARLGIGITELAAMAGVSRQTVHTLLKPGFQPLPASVEAIAAVLDVDPIRLVVSSGSGDSPEPPVEELLTESAAGSSRAFELLPARLVADSVGRPGRMLHPADPVRNRLAAAAAEMANALSPSPRLRALVDFHARKQPAHHAFFFGTGLMTPERIIRMTPEPLRKHGVFGAFAIEDFARHR